LSDEFVNCDFKKIVGYCKFAI